MNELEQVLTLMMVAFHFHLELAEPGQLQPPTRLDVYVNPTFGFFGFLAATVLSLIITHVLLFYERRSHTTDASAPSSESNADVDGSAEITSDSQLQVHAPPELRLALRHRLAVADQRMSLVGGHAYHNLEYGGQALTDRLVAPVLVGSAVLQLVGACVRSFSFRFGGIAGWALSLIDKSLVETSFSMLSLGAWHSLCRVVLLILVLTPVCESL